MLIRSIALLVCVVWMALDIGLWIARSKTLKYKEALFCLCFCVLSVGTMLAMWRFLASTLEEQEEDVFQNLTTDITIPTPDDVFGSYFTLKNGGKSSIGHIEYCHIHLIVAVSGDYYTGFRIMNSTTGWVLGPGTEAESIQCLRPPFGSTMVPIVCADVEFDVHYSLEDQPEIRKEKYFRFTGVREENQFVFVRQPPGGGGNNRTDDYRYCGSYLKQGRVPSP